MSYRSRALLIVGMITVAGAAYATARWQPWSPVSACLLCETRSAGSTAVATSGADPVGGVAAGSYARSSAGGGNAGALVPLPLAPGPQDGTASGSRPESSRRGWQPWAAGSGTFRVNSSSASGPTAPLGGLWRLMSLSRPAAPTVAGTHETPRTTAGRPAASPAAPVARKPAPPSSHPAPGASSPATITAADGVTPPPTDTFHDHQDPPPDPFGGGTVPGGGFDPGSPGGARPPAGGGVSATPEPGSVLLVGTGLLGILGALRRRRLI